MIVGLILLEELVEVSMKEKGLECKARVNEGLNSFPCRSGIVLV